MKKTILITGSTDGIGLETAKELASLGHTVLLHGRSLAKLEAAKETVVAESQGADVQTYLADLSSLSETKELAQNIQAQNKQIDVIINNAGIFKTTKKETSDGLDLRFTVNTISPYLLTTLLLPNLASDGRVVNLSSAAQAPVAAESLTKVSSLNDSQVYAQSKLALTMWTNALAKKIGGNQVITSLNPKSFIGSKMVKEAYGVEGSSLKDGSDILVRATLSKDFANASGKYFDNDIGLFSQPHPEALDMIKCETILNTLNALINR